MSQATEFSKPLNSSVFSGLVRQHGSIQFMESYGGSEDDVQTALKLTSSGTAFMVHSTCGTPGTVLPDRPAFQHSNIPTSIPAFSVNPRTLMGGATRPSRNEICGTLSSVLSGGVGWKQPTRPLPRVQC